MSATTQYPTALFFGCWNQAGHYWFAPGGQRASLRFHAFAHNMVPMPDGGYAPVTLDGETTFIASGGSYDANKRIERRGVPFPDGQFLRHLVNGCTLIAWWDRCQGDGRSGSNSMLVVDGEHDVDVMLEALQREFPHVITNLHRAGVELVYVPSP